MLSSFNIRLLADIRSFPGSKRFPQFNQFALEQALNGAGINYRHFPDLGGKRRLQENGATEAPAGLKGYTAYMQTPTFGKAIEQLQLLAADRPVAYMCAEAVWWQCHRSYVSDHLKATGWKVFHIIDIAKGEDHPGHRVEKASQGELF